MVFSLCEGFCSPSREGSMGTSEVAPKGTSTPPIVFPSFLFVFSSFVFPCQGRVNKYATKSVPDVLPEC